MNIRFEIPDDIADQLKSEGVDLNHEAREVFLVELYRQERVSHYQLSEALGLCRYETDGVLKRHGVDYGLTIEEFRAEAEFLKALLDKERSRDLKGRS